MKAPRTPWEPRPSLSLPNGSVCDGGDEHDLTGDLYEGVTAGGHHFVFCAECAGKHALQVVEE